MTRYSYRISTIISLLKTNIMIAFPDTHISLFIYFRKIPNLRLCVEPRDSELWFKHMKDEKIDFEVS